MDTHWPEWLRFAACLEVGVEGFFPEDNDSTMPRRVCEGCTVRLLCLDRQMRFEQGLGYKHRFGIVGGLSPFQRMKHEPEWLAEQEVA